MSVSVSRFGRVAVVYGGPNSEREVSLASGARVLEGLREAGVDAHGVDYDGTGRELLRALDGFDRAFLILHGAPGEDGTVQGALETIGLPYTGSGVRESAVAMDKALCKQLWRAAGVPTPQWREVTDERQLETVAEALGLPLVVKPACEGSSVGVGRAFDGESLLSAWFEAARFDGTVIVEPLLPGPELTIAMLGGELLPLVRVEPAREFYDYEAKYADGTGTQYHVPTGLGSATEASIAELAKRAFDAVGVTSWGRADIMLDADGTPWFIDLNTAPGMTEHSLVPMAAKARGIGFPELVCRILESSL